VQPLTLDLIMRVLMVATGLLVAGHYHCMANFISRAPHTVRLLLVCASAAGVGMAATAVLGTVLQAAYFAVAASACMVLINLAAFAAGAYVSEQFARADRMKRNRQMFMREAVDGAVDMARFLDAESQPAPLEATVPPHLRSVPEPMADSAPASARQQGRNA
jgi:hypothetical protein